MPGRRKVQQALAKLPELTDVASDQQSTAPQLTLEIDRQTASRLGITPAAIDSVLDDAFGQRPISQLYTSLNQYFVILEANRTCSLAPMLCSGSMLHRNPPGWCHSANW